MDTIATKNKHVIRRLLLFFLLVQFNSYRRVGIILLTVPLATVGIVRGLVLCGSRFGFQSLLGVRGLVGIVVNNSIILVDYINVLRRRGVKLKEALVTAAETRLTPIFLTALTTIAGLFSLATGLGGQSLIWGPVATAIVWGLAFSTVLTLVVVPSLYSLVEHRMERFRR